MRVSPCIPRIGERIYGLDDGRTYVVEQVYHNVRALGVSDNRNADVSDFDVEILELPENPTPSNRFRRVTST